MQPITERGSDSIVCISLSILAIHFIFLGHSHWFHSEYSRCDPRDHITRFQGKPSCSSIAIPANINVHYSSLAHTFIKFISALNLFYLYGCICILLSTIQERENRDVLVERSKQKRERKSRDVASVYTNLWSFMET